MQRAFVLLGVLAASAFIAAGCGSGAGSATGAVELGFMTWGDPTGASDKMYRDCEKQSGNKYKIVATAMGPTVDAAREQLTRRLGAGDPAIDLINLDTVWTPEFADAGWLRDISKEVEPIKDTFIKPSLASTFYKGKYWGVPVNTNAALLYYRTDLVKTPPTTWEELAKMSKEVQAKHPEMAGFVFQGAPSESGTVDALEFLYGNGTQILSEDGKKSLISKGDAAEQTFTFLQSLIKTGVSPKVVTTFTEEETRAAFQNGGAVFMRNWPYAESLMQSDKSSKVKGKIGLTTLPSFEGHPPVSVLGGQNFGVSNTSDTPDLAWQAMSCLASAKMQTIKAIAKGELPGIQALYDSPELTSKISYLSHSKKAISQGHNRPTTPYYGDVTSSIYQSYNDLLAMRLSPREAVKKMNRMVQAAIDGKAEI